MSEKYKGALQEHNKFIKDEMDMISNGARVSSLRELKPRQKQLRRDLLELVKHVSKTGEIDIQLWPEYRNLLAALIKEILDRFNLQFKDSLTFEQQKQVILQYIVFFERPPFTIQRISQLTLDPDRYYRSTKKLLYAYEKLVNVADPEDK